MSCRWVASQLAITGYDDFAQLLIACSLRKHTHLERLLRKYFVQPPKKIFRVIFGTSCLLEFYVPLYSIIS